MSSNHTAQIGILHGINTLGYFSYKNPTTLIIFVHGFGGSTQTTWSTFPSLSLQDSKCKKSDILIYGYDTFRGQAGDHAAELYHFINLAVAPLKNNILPADQHLPERKYKRIIFVAHSLGAVLARQAQLLAYIDKRKWVNKSMLVLFAPAHHGTDITSLVKEALSGVNKLISLFGLLNFPILNDLDAKDGGILNSIKTQTESLQNKGKANFTKAKLVVHAKGDKVVKSYQYLLDKPAEIIKNKNHISVCKPDVQYLKPFELLKSIL
ncbi:MAG: alpha/beta hydrolase [Bacteroidota bacterium]